MLSWQPIPLLVLLLVLPTNAAGQGATPAAADTTKLPTLVEYAAGPRPPEQQALIKEVIETLRREQPQNPGRIKTFIKLQLRGLTPQNRDTHLLKQTGWLLEVREAGRIEGGWRATVAVRIFATTLGGWPVPINNDHYEVYVCKNGKLEMEDDYTDPELQFRTDYKLSDGLLPVLPLSLPPAGRQPPPDTYHVGIWLEGKPSETDRQLAKEVQAVLKREQPQNPSRLKSFPKLEVDWLTQDGKQTEHYKFKIEGWSLVVRRADRIPGGWRATILVSPQLKDERTGYVPRHIFNYHTEVYVYRDGKLTMESESLDPKRDGGLFGMR